jgi:hypothetical protein
MIETRWTRLLVLGLLIGLLCSLLLWAGTLEADPTRNVFPDEDDFAVDYDAYIGADVETDGTILATNPVVVEVTPDGHEPLELTLTNVDPPTVQEDDQISVFGTLETDATISVTTITVRSPWEFQYMYLVSFLAGLWTLGRFRRHWTLNTDTLSFSPREEP